MKKKISVGIIVCILIQLSLHAQDNAHEEQGTESIIIDQPAHAAVVSPTKMNVFYIGANNPVQIVADGYKSYTVTISNGKIFKQGDEYFVRVTDPGMCTLTLVTPDGKEISKSEFRVKKITTPSASVLKFSSNQFAKEPISISKEKLEEVKTVSSVLENFDFKTETKIESFILDIEDVNPPWNTPIVLKSNGDKLTDAMINALKSVKKDQNVSFSYILAKMEDGSLRRVADLKFVVQ